MKARITLFVSALLLSASVRLSAQVAEIPAKVYVNQESAHKTTVFNLDYVTRIGVTHGTVSNRNDSLKLEFPDGTSMRYVIRTVDSLTFYAPDSLMRAHLSYQDRNYSKFYPSYSDDYVSLAGWNNRTKWQLANIHDPSVMKAADGYFYMTQTDASYGNAHAGHGHYYMRRSADLVNWEPASSFNNSCPMLETGPAWLLDSINSVRARRGVPAISADNLGGLGYWAPVIRKVNDSLYRMYYSVVVDGNFIKTGSTTFDNSWNEPAWIGLMETSDPSSGKWEDKGGILCSASDKGKDDYYRASTSDWKAYSRFNAIDPSYIITPEGEHWLVYGSWHSGIAALQLDAETGRPLTPVGNPWNIGTGQTTTHGTLIATRNKSSRWQGSEGPEIIYNPSTGYYYLFLAYDELAVAYNTRVVRSKNITGPYYGMNGTNVSVNGGDAYPVVTHPYKFNSSADVDGWVGFSHCGVFDDGNGNWYYTSQGRKPENYKGNAYSNALMMGHVRRIYWNSAGWPVVSPERYAAVEQAPISRDDLVGTWELIDLSYSYGNQKTSATLTISASNYNDTRVVLTGALRGTGVFDAETNILKVTPSSGTAFELCLGRELDWEASPRKSTIVCGGYTSNGKTTYWGKKVN